MPEQIDIDALFPWDPGKGSDVSRPLLRRLENVFRRNWRDYHVPVPKTYREVLAIGRYKLSKMSMVGPKIMAVADKIMKDAGLLAVWYPTYWKDIQREKCLCVLRELRKSMEGQKGPEAANDAEKFLYKRRLPLSIKAIDAEV